MPQSLLRRTRGLELELLRRPRERRRCGLEELGGVDPSGRGRYSVAIERLGAESAAVRLGGELDLAAAPAIDAAMRRVERWSPLSVLVDAADVGFVDLTVIGRLVAANARLEESGGSLLVVHPPQCLLRILDVLDELDLPVLR